MLADVVYWNHSAFLIHSVLVISYSQSKGFMTNNIKYRLEIYIMRNNLFSLLLSLGLPAIIVVVCLGIATGNDGIETFVNDER